MATTRFMSRHIWSGKTIMKILKDSFDYEKNPNKTIDGDLIMAYACDPNMTDAEFLPSKAKYKAIKGREQRRMYCITKVVFLPVKLMRKLRLKLAMNLLCVGQKVSTLF